MAVPWAWAFDTPFTWTKQIASHFGGVRQGMAISWPKVIKDKGGIRNQFHHVIDIVPTILEAANDQAAQGRRRHQAEPDRGREHGVHVRQGQRERAVDAQDAVFRDDGRPRDLPRRLDRQHQGDASAVGHQRRRRRGPRRAIPWELYDLTQRLDAVRGRGREESGQAEGVADLFWQEAKKYQVLPLDATVATRLITPRPSITAGRNVFTWTAPLTGTPNGDAPSILNASYNFKADVDIPQGGAEGMLITQGGRFGGYGFYVLKGKPVFTGTWSTCSGSGGRVADAARARQALARIRLQVRRPRHGHARLQQHERHRPRRHRRAQGRRQGGRRARRWSARFRSSCSGTRTSTSGPTPATPVDDSDYQVPFAFTGKINKITLTIDRPQLTPTDEKKLEQATRNNKTSE